MPRIITNINTTVTIDLYNSIIYDMIFNIYLLNIIVIISECKFMVIILVSFMKTIEF
jgi:hypothetical protein